MQLAKLKMKIKKSFIIVLLSLIALSYIRNTTFIVIHAALTKKPTNYANARVPDLLQQLTEKQLIFLKWGLMAVFSVLFVLLSGIAIRAYFKNKHLTQLTFIIYISLILFCILAFLVASSLHIQQIEHAAQTMVLFIHSPLVLLILTAIFTLKNSN